VVIITSSAFTKCEFYFHWRDGIAPEIKTHNFSMNSGPDLSPQVDLPLRSTIPWLSSHDP
jgi:hypothetical protein